MGIESNLRKEGIKVTEELDKIKVNTIAKNVAQKIVAAFPELDFKLGDVFIKLSQLKMYYAEVPKGFSEANYFYKNTSIYFNQEVPIEKSKIMLFMNAFIIYKKERIKQDFY